MKYDILYADTVEELVAMVNHLINEGWELLGDPWTDSAEYGNLFWYQAIIKKPVVIA